MRRICVIGTGYVGLVTGACLADFGNLVICVDKDEAKISLLDRGEIPFYEPGLKELMERNVARMRLSFSTDLPQAIRRSEIIFVAVGTPSLDNGEADLSQVFQVAQDIGHYMDGYKVVVNKSTVSVGTGARMAQVIREHQSHLTEFDIVSNPEFLREGSAIEDFMRPNRVVIGANSERALEIMAEIYRPLYLIETPIVKTDVETAEMIKYASNAFLAAKISFINEIANLCEHLGADVHVVARAMGLDQRIGSKFLHPGPGFGGSCLPKDTMALSKLAEKVGVKIRIVNAVIEVNRLQRERMVGKIKALVGDLRGKTIGILGLSFKPNTDDIREAPALVIIERLLEAGARIKAYDPAAMPNMRVIFREVEYCDDPYAVAQGAHALVLVTEWNEFRELDLSRIKDLLKEPNVIDCRNIYPPDLMAGLGFNYVGVGRLPKAGGDFHHA